LESDFVQGLLEHTLRFGYFLHTTWGAALQVFLAIVSLQISGIALYLGVHYAGVPCNNLPIFFLVDGAVGFPLVISRVVLFCMLISIPTAISRPWCYGVFGCIVLLLQLFAMAWLITGSVWTYSITSALCGDPTLYTIAFWYMIGVWIFVVSINVAFVVAFQLWVPPDDDNGG